MEHMQNNIVSGQDEAANTGPEQASRMPDAGRYELLLDAYLDHLDTEKRLSNQSIRAYAHDLVQFTAHARQIGKHAASVDNDDVSLWLEKLAKDGISPKSQARKLSSLRGFFKFLLQERQVSADPTRLIVGPKSQNKLPETLTSAEVEALLGLPDRGTPRGLRDYVMIQLLYAVGLRVSELVGLRLNDIDVASLFVSVSSHAEKRRTLYFDESLRDALVEYLRDVRPRWLSLVVSEHFFITDRGRGMTRQNFWKLLSRYACDARINRPISPTQLRHSFAVHMIESGADVRSVQNMLGHADISTTSTYVRVAYDRVGMLCKELR
jgi:integrase/recombinase XerD